jgi:hypothetical protein
MRIYALAAFAATASLALAGCNTSVSSTTQADINAALTAICDYVPALAPLKPSLNADLQNDITQAQVICAGGSPTNPVAAGIDIVAIYEALEPYFAKAAPQSKATLHRIDAKLKARGLR